MATQLWREIQSRPRAAESPVALLIPDGRIITALDTPRYLTTRDTTNNCSRKLALGGSTGGRS